MTVRILVGDCREQLRTLEDGSVQTCVTSPPYFGLRDYGHDGQIGLETTPADFVEAMVEVFREVRRVLRDDGTVWLNLGDSYASGTKGTGGTGKSGPMRDGRRESGRQSADAANGRAKFEPIRLQCGLADKQLMGIPWRVAFALQDDGWYLRQDIIWSKPNPMPESVRDRCTKAHEYIFMLSKGSRYYFDAEAIKEPEVCGRKRGPALHGDQVSTNGNGGLSRRESDGFRNRRTVWTVPTRAFKGAHFATFPPALIEPCILAGSPPLGVVLDPFGGAGTTGLVAQALGRDAILCELNPVYAEMARARIDEGLTPPKPKPARKAKPPLGDEIPLFEDVA